MGLASHGGQLHQPLHVNKKVAHVAEPNTVVGGCTFISCMA